MNQSGFCQYDHRSYEIARNSTYKMSKENDVVEYLMESKPPFLKLGDSLLGIDQHSLNKEYRGIADKLSIHGYSDRSDRLLYLYTVLSNKLSDKEDVLKSILKLLLEMSERPTAVIRLNLGMDLYSNLPDSEMSDDESSHNQKELLKIILGEKELDQITLSYSSDSELSDWSSDEESEKSKRSTNDIVIPTENLKPSQSFSDFSEIKVPKNDDERRKELELFWGMEAIRATNFMNTDLRQTANCVKPLRNQPVISGLLTLHAKFGEYWEWKKVSRRNDLLLITEEDVIREILWQFSALNAESSPVFTSDFKLRTGLMVATLSQSSFTYLMEHFGNVLSSLYKFRIFVATILQTVPANEFSTSPDKILRSYAQGLSDIVNYVAEEVSHVEENLRRDISEANQPTQPCTTLIQVFRQLRILTDVVQLLDRVHSLNMKYIESSPPNQLSSIQLFFNLAAQLNLQTHGIKFGVILFLFSKCLHAFLDQINSAMISLNWAEHLLFSRSPDVKLSDHNFWTEAIKLLPYETILQQNEIPTVQCIDKLIPEILIVLKTSEILNQLGEDYGKILGAPPPAMEIVKEFLDVIVPSDEEIIPVIPTDSIVVIPDGDTHFRFIGLEGSLVADSVKYILKKQIERSKPKQARKDNFCLKSLIKLGSIPNMNHWEALRYTLLKWYSPFCERGKNCVHKIFQDYAVDQSMKLFREIILGIRDDFAHAVIAIASATNSSKRYTYEDEMNRNPAFQKILNECYPEGRENFDLEFKLDRTSETNYALVVKPRFPLNLILLDDSVEGYLFVSKQLHRIRKSLWETTALNIKDVKVIDGVEPNRILLFRFCLIHFCSSIRAYLVFKIFGKDLSVSTSSYSYDLDAIRRAHADHLQAIETKLLRCPVMENVVIRKMNSMSQTLCRYWTTGCSSKTMVLLEDTLKKCWSVIHSFQRHTYSSDFNELSYHFGPVPSYL